MTIKHPSQSSTHKLFRDSSQEFGVDRALQDHQPDQIRGSGTPRHTAPLENVSVPKKQVAYHFTNLDLLPGHDLRHEAGTRSQLLPPL